VRFKPELGFEPKDYEERVIAVSDTLLACLKRFRGDAPEDALIFPSPITGTVDKHLDRIIHSLIDKANRAGYQVKKPRKPCHASRVLYATRRHQKGVDIETLRQELGHSKARSQFRHPNPELAGTSLLAGRRSGTQVYESNETTNHRDNSSEGCNYETAIYPGLVSHSASTPCRRSFRRFDTHCGWHGRHRIRTLQFR
jgi:hypothetical protein